MVLSEEEKNERKKLSNAKQYQKQKEKKQQEQQKKEAQREKERNWKRNQRQKKKMNGNNNSSNGPPGKPAGSLPTVEASPMARDLLPYALSGQLSEKQIQCFSDMEVAYQGTQAAFQGIETEALKLEKTKSQLHLEQSRGENLKTIAAMDKDGRDILKKMYDGKDDDKKPAEAGTKMAEQSTKNKTVSFKGDDQAEDTQKSIQQILKQLHDIEERAGTTEQDEQIRQQIQNVSHDVCCLADHLGVDTSNLKA